MSCDIKSEKLEKQEENHKRESSFIEKLLLENEQILAEILTESKYRKNKNIITPKMSLLVNRLERNLIRIARDLPPQNLADPPHVLEEKDRFLRFYQKRNGAKKIYPSASKPREKDREL